MKSPINWWRMIGYSIKDAMSTHPPERTLVEIALADQSSIPNLEAHHKLKIAQHHTSNCNRCKTLLSQIYATLKRIDEEVNTSQHTTPALGHDQLKQRWKILRHIDRYFAPRARLLHFPSTSRSSFGRLTPLTVSLIMMCAVGPFLGIAVRQSVVSSDSALVTPPPVRLERDPGLVQSKPENTNTLEQTDVNSDESLMAEIDYAVQTPRISSLLALDELTPRLREVSTAVR
tara:strand:- start:867 stop:1559 length:693 start_codon:yes stop_codon:yes gene_type:complete